MQNKLAQNLCFFQKQLDINSSEKQPVFKNDESLMNIIQKNTPLIRQSRSNSFTCQSIGQLINSTSSKQKGQLPFIHKTLTFNPQPPKQQNEKSPCQSFEQIFNKRQLSQKQQQCLKNSFEKKIDQLILDNNKKLVEKHTPIKPKSFFKHQPKKQLQNLKLRSQMAYIKQSQNLIDKINKDSISIKNDPFDNNLINQQSEPDPQIIKDQYNFKNFYQKPEIIVPQSVRQISLQCSHKSYNISNEVEQQGEQSITNIQYDKLTQLLTLTEDQPLCRINTSFSRYKNSQLPLSSFIKIEKENKKLNLTEPSQNIYKQRFGISVQIKTQNNDQNYVNKFAQRKSSLGARENECSPWKNGDDYEHDFHFKQFKLR